eukprot:COSAG01_NODE_915_length_12761_cov_33.161507_12_plen_124_part_00
MKSRKKLLSSSTRLRSLASLVVEYLRSRNIMITDTNSQKRREISARSGFRLDRVISTATQYQKRVGKSQSIQSPDGHTYDAEAVPLLRELELVAPLPIRPQLLVQPCVGVIITQATTMARDQD